MASFCENPVLGDLYKKALIYAADKHRFQVRKDGSPYLGHLLGVSSLVLEFGGSENAAIAGLFHDLIEDVGVVYAEIAEEFGIEIANIVEAVTEDKALPKQTRKNDYIETVGSSSDEVQLVALCDKIHNLRSYMQNPKLFTEEVKSFYLEFLKIQFDSSLAVVVELLRTEFEAACVDRESPNFIKRAEIALKKVASLNDERELIAYAQACGVVEIAKALNAPR